MHGDRTSTTGGGRTSPTMTPGSKLGRCVTDYDLGCALRPRPFGLIVFIHQHVTLFQEFSDPVEESDELHQKPHEDDSAAGVVELRNEGHHKLIEICLINNKQQPQSIFIGADVVLVKFQHLKLVDGLHHHSQLLLPALFQTGFSTTVRAFENYDQVIYTGNHALDAFLCQVC